MGGVVAPQGVRFMKGSTGHIRPRYAEVCLTPDTPWLSMRPALDEGGSVPGMSDRHKRGMMRNADWSTRIGMAGVVLSIAFYVFYLPSMAPDSRRFRRAFRAAPASLAGVLSPKRDPLDSYLEPMSIARPFVQAAFVPESRVISGLPEEGD